MSKIITYLLFTARVSLETVAKRVSPNQMNQTNCRNQASLPQSRSHHRQNPHQNPLISRNQIRCHNLAKRTPGLLPEIPAPGFAQVNCPHDVLPTPSFRVNRLDAELSFLRVSQGLCARSDGVEVGNANAANAEVYF